VEIEKNIHFIWLGSVIPQEYLTNIVNWSQINPEFKPFLWVDRHYSPNSSISKDLVAQNGIELKYIYAEKDLQTLTSSNFFKVWFNEQAPLYSIAADILRLAILYLYGGVYSDCDVTCASNAKPLNEFLAGKLFVGYGRDNKVRDNCIIAAKSGNMLFLEALAKHFDNQYKHIEQDKVEPILPFKLSGFADDKQNHTVLFSKRLRASMEGFIVRNFGACVYMDIFKDLTDMGQIPLNLAPTVDNLNILLSDPHNDLLSITVPDAVYYMQPTYFTSLDWEELGYAHQRHRNWLVAK